MPTGHALHDPRRQLFDAAVRVLLRDGPSALTGRSITAEAGVAKGVLHRHFPDVDTFLVELINDRIRGFEDVADGLSNRVGRGSVSENVAIALPELLNPVVLALVPQIITRDEIRRRVAASPRPGPPLLSEAVAVVESYLRQERAADRVTADADVATSAFSIIATGYMLLTGELGALPDAGAVYEVVESILVGIERDRRPR